MTDDPRTRIRAPRRLKVENDVLLAQRERGPDSGDPVVGGAPDDGRC